MASKIPRCGPCKDEEQNVIAYCYCPTCMTYMCERCHRVHARLPVTREHRILSDDDIPGSQQGKAFDRGETEVKVGELKHLKVAGQTNMRIRVDGEKTGCNITGKAILKDGGLILADKGNENVKMYSQEGILQSSLKLPCPPWDVCVVKAISAVVTLPGLGMYVLDVSVRSKPSILRRVPLSGNSVRGITICGDSLVFTNLSNPPRVMKMKLNEQVEWSVHENGRAEKLFDQPLYLQYGATIVVSDWLKETLTVLDDVTGSVLKVHHLRGKQPKGMTQDERGNLYICCSYTKEICVFSKCFLESKCLVSNCPGRPQAIAYDRNKDELLVSFEHSDTIVAYTLLQKKHELPLQ